MFDYPSISSAFSSIKAAADIAKLIRESVVSLEKAELNLKISNLLISIADVNTSLAEIKQTILEKDNLINDLNKLLEVKGKIYFDTHFYWLEENEQKDGPYCQPCYDKDNKLIRLQKLEVGSWECKVCKNHFFTDEFDPAPAFYHSE